MAQFVDREDMGISGIEIQCQTCCWPGSDGLGFSPMDGSNHARDTGHEVHALITKRYRALGQLGTATFTALNRPDAQPPRHLRPRRIVEYRDPTRAPARGGQICCSCCSCCSKRGVLEQQLVVLEQQLILVEQQEQQSPPSARAWNSKFD